jgi:hypothetical protein
MKHYRAKHSELTSATAAHVWSLWMDVNNWPVWDEGVAACDLKGAFTPGACFSLTPRGAPEPVQVTLIEVVPNTRFIDETHLPFGVLRATHTLEEEGEKRRVTHTIEAEITPTHSAFFEQAIWSHIEQGVTGSVAKLVRLAECR